MSDFHVREGDRVFLATSDGLLLRVVFGESSVELSSAGIRGKLDTTYSSDRAIAVDIKDKPVEKIHPCGCFGTECRGGFGHG